jgi:hypothetical protein
MDHIKLTRTDLDCMDHRLQVRQAFLGDPLVLIAVNKVDIRGSSKDPVEFLADLLHDTVPS